MIIFYFVKGMLKLFNDFNLKTFRFSLCVVMNVPAGISCIIGQCLFFCHELDYCKKTCQVCFMFSLYFLFGILSTGLLNEKLSAFMTSKYYQKRIQKSEIVDAWELEDHFTLYSSDQVYLRVVRNVKNVLNCLFILMTKCW